MNSVYKSLFMVLAISNYFCSSASSILDRQKRELFRENLLPDTGGKVPDSAFDFERISQNILNQNGFYSVNGQYLQQRHPNRHYIPKKFMPPTIKLNPKKYKYFRPNENDIFPSSVVDTTYIIAKPITYKIFPHYYKQTLPVTPKLSLKLKNRNFKIHKQRKESESEASKIFEEFSHYLTKVHEND